MRCKNSEYKSNSSPFLKAFLKTGRVWDDAAKKEWADDVERRLREVTVRIDPKLIQLGYTIQRVKNCVSIYTITPDPQTKRNIAALSQGQWPCWGKIVKAVPELTHSPINFDACTSLEWWRKWDVEDEMRRLRFEHGVFA